MAKVSTEPYKGVRDFYPEDMSVQKYLFRTMRKVVRSFGYVEYSASPLEPIELYKGKTSEEIVNEQTYSFTDRGGRDITLRPEMTPTLARMVAARRKALSFPLRWYSLPTVFRYERPQKGRLREHRQLNCDLLGVAGLEAEVEIISMAHALMKRFRAKDEDFEIRINSRSAMNAMLGELGLDAEGKRRMIALIDRKDKIDNFEEEAEKIVGKPFSLPSEEPADVAELRGLLAQVGVENAVYDPGLARGFDYYTGIVFEVFDKNPENRRALFGGGRYDNLLEMFGEEPVPAVGFGMGDVTIKDFLEVRGLLPEPKPSADLFLATVSGEVLPETERLAMRLRERGLKVIVNLSKKKVGDQIAYASKQHVPFLILVGPDELKSKRYALKRLATGEDTPIEEDAIPRSVAENA